jgi:hypothetical protein
MQAYSKMCEYYSTMYQLELKVQQIEVRMIQMDMCMQVQQHIMDIGRCDQNPESCFNQMVTCVNFADISSAAGELSTIIANGNNALATMNKDLTAGINTLGISTGSSNAIVYATCGSSLTAQPNCCSEVSGSGGLVTTCPSQNSFLRVQTTSGSCQYPVVTNTCGIVGNFEYLACRGSTCTSGYQLPLPSTAGSKDTYQFKLYCFTSENSFTSAVGSNPVPGTSIDASKISSYKSTSNQWAFVYARGSGSSPSNSEDRCKCADLTPSAQCVTTGTTTGTTTPTQNKPPEITKFQPDKTTGCASTESPIPQVLLVTFTIDANDPDGKIISIDVVCKEGYHQNVPGSLPQQTVQGYTADCYYDTPETYTARIDMIDDKSSQKSEISTPIIVSQC